MDVLFLFMFATSVHIVVSSYYIEAEPSVWGNQTCQIAIPTLNYTHKALSISSAEDISYLNITSDGVRIGFYRARVTYTFVGCSQGYNNKTPMHDIHSIGECMSASGCRTFGIWMSKWGLRCRCAQGIDVSATKCNSQNTSFEYPSGSKNNMAVYYTVKSTFPSETTELCGSTHCNCLSYLGNKLYEWIRCSVSNGYPRVLCSDKNFTDGSQAASSVNEYSESWILALQKCSVLEMYPATYQSILNNTLSSSDVQIHWTGMMKQSSVLTLKEEDLPYAPVSYAVLLENGTVVFSTENSMMKSLCYHYDTSTASSISTYQTLPDVSSTSSTSVKTTDNTSVLANITYPTRSSSQSTTAAKATTTPAGATTTATTATITTPTTTEAASVTTATIHTTKLLPETPASLDKPGSTIGLAAGLSVSLVVLIVVTVILLLYLKRRGVLPMCLKQNGKQRNHTVVTSTEKSFISTPVFESTTNKNTMGDLKATNHSDFLLERTFENSNKVDADHNAEQDLTDVDHYDLTQTSHKDSDNDYDTTGDKNGHAKSGLAKHNKVFLSQSDEYDHIHPNRRQSKSDIQTENEYDISNDDIDGKRIERFGDDSDTYNHLSQNYLKRSGTNNVYGTQETDGDNEYDTSGALKGGKNAAPKARQNDYAVVKKK